MVGTRTKILNLFYLLFAYEGKIRCSNCNEMVDSNLNCPKCGNSEERLESSFFSSNSFQGMCLNCKGYGYIKDLNWEYLIPDDSTTLRQVLINGGVLTTFNQRIKNLKKNFEFSLDSPFRQLSKEVQDLFIQGISPGKSQRSRLNLDPFYLIDKYIIPVIQ